MKYMPNSVSRKIGRALLQSQKNSPRLMFGVGIVGAVSATVLACRATLKLEAVVEDAGRNLEVSKQLVDKELHDYTEEDQAKDTLYIYIRTAAKLGKLYAPALIVGVVSVGALTGSHVTLTRRNAALTAAYSALGAGFAEYRARVVEEFGEDKERELRYSSETTKVEDGKTKDGKPKTKEVQTVGVHGKSVYARFFDEYSQSWDKKPEYNHLFLQCKQNYANDLLHARGHVFLNEVYDSLGIDRSQAGAVVGWVVSKDGDNFIDFGIFDGSFPAVRDFVNGREGSILLDFNVDGVIYDLI